VAEHNRKVSRLPPFLAGLLLGAALTALVLGTRAAAGRHHLSERVSQADRDLEAALAAELSALNEKLRSELADSRQTSKSLRDTLAKSSTELDGLKAELEHLRRASTGLSAGSVVTEEPHTVARGLGRDTKAPL
jgi:septal ring factor EnvC (AmiA/AmiB activator)